MDNYNTHALRKNIRALWQNKHARSGSLALSLNPTNPAITIGFVSLSPVHCISHISHSASLSRLSQKFDLQPHSLSFTRRFLAHIQAQRHGHFQQLLFQQDNEYGVNRELFLTIRMYFYCISILRMKNTDFCFIVIHILIQHLACGFDVQIFYKFFASFQLWVWKFTCAGGHNDCTYIIISINHNFLKIWK